MRRIVRERSLSGRAIEAHEIHGRIVPGSLAEYMALWESLRQLDSDLSLEARMEASKKRKDFLLSQMEKHGSIRCAYCGRPGLIIAQMDQTSLKRLATVDHFIPTSHGGPNDERNFVPSCRRCNGIKSNSMPTEIPKYATPDVAERLLVILSDPPHMALARMRWDEMG